MLWRTCGWHLTMTDFVLSLIITLQVSTSPILTYSQPRAMSRREVVGDSDLYTLTKVSLQDQYFHLSLMTKNKKTYNSGDSLVVTHLTTSPPVKGLTCGEQTGSSILLYLWSYVKVLER
jgi:hypothetical protein